MPSFHPAKWLACTLVAIIPLDEASAMAEGCPSNQSPIATDRPDVTNSSLVVPAGSLQIENGINFSESGGSRILDGTASRVRLGVAPCLEVLLDLPSYFATVHGAHAS